MCGDHVEYSVALVFFSKVGKCFLQEDDGILVHYVCLPAIRFIKRKTRNFNCMSYIIIKGPPNMIVCVWSLIRAFFDFDLGQKALLILI